MTCLKICIVFGQSYRSWSRIALRLWPLLHQNYATPLRNRALDAFKNPSYPIVPVLFSKLGKKVFWNEKVEAK
jgi:hypothetical protein